MRVYEDGTIGSVWFADYKNWSAMEEKPFTDKLNR